MIISVRKWLDRIRFLIVFIALTYFMIHVVGWMSDWIAPVNRYRVPQGKALKAFQHGSLVDDIESDSVKDRLRLFYWYGE